MRQPGATEATMGVMMVVETPTLALVTGVLLVLDYDAVEGMQN